MNDKANKGYIQLLIETGSTFVDIIKRESVFLSIVVVSFLSVGLFYKTPAVAMWIGFILAAYSAIGNDSIQTIGTFISSNKAQRWWYLWLYMGGIFVVTVTIGWFINDGDVSYGRLLSKGFETAPTEFSFWQVSAPIILLILTRLRMPVSTTFLLLSCFAADASAIHSVIGKSVTGYGYAFIIAVVVWVSLSKIVEKSVKSSKAHPAWYIAQWLTSGGLWAVWIMQDAANIAVFLPRSLDVIEFVAFTSIIFFGLAILFYLKGDKIQQIVEEKSSVNDVRAATLIDFVYACIMIYFQAISPTPMSTTWVFIGLLAGRELGMYFTNTSVKPTFLSVAKIIGRDALFAGIGLTVSVIIASLVNKAIFDAIMTLLGL